MKKLTAILTSLLLTLPALQADTVSVVWTNGVDGVSFSDNGKVPDASPAGWWDARSYTNILWNNSFYVDDVNVYLGLSDTYNGDLYAYLAYQDPLGVTRMAVLLNRVGVTATDGFGYNDKGFGATDGTGVLFKLDNEALNDVHLYEAPGANPVFAASGQLTGTWQPDGRAASPTNVTDVSSRTLLLDQLDGLAPNGTWTLYLADLSVGGGNTTVGYWGLELSVVPIPEPTLLALLALGGALGWRSVARRRRS